MAYWNMRLIMPVRAAARERISAGHRSAVPRRPGPRAPTAVRRAASSTPACLPWRLYVLDLRTMAETPTAERRGIDDQALWLDRRTLAYAMPGDSGSDLWSVPADGSGVGPACRRRARTGSGAVRDLLQRPRGPAGAGPVRCRRPTPSTTRRRESSLDTLQARPALADCRAERESERTRA
ncbi:peptidoglycan-associated lipoprotein [Kitasatospora purpeofusca]